MTRGGRRSRRTPMMGLGTPERISKKKDKQGEGAAAAEATRADRRRMAATTE